LKYNGEYVVKKMGTFLTVFFSNARAK
jgi:hypothetical protein